jgi:hypothetical protein
MDSKNCALWFTAFGLVLLAALLWVEPQILLTAFGR